MNTHFARLASFPVTRIAALALLAGMLPSLGACAADTAPAEAMSEAEPLTVLSRYAFTIDGLQIENTRAVGQDTDLVSIAGKVGADPAILPRTTQMNIGDVNNGWHPVGLTLAPLAIGSGQTAHWSFVVVNSGTSGGTSGQVLSALDSLSDISKDIVNGLWKSDLWQAADDATKKLNAFFVGWCDGMVAVDAIDVDAATLAQWTANGPHTERRHYAGRDSRVFCGSNSSYDVQFTVARKNAIVVPPPF